MSANPIFGITGQYTPAGYVQHRFIDQPLQYHPAPLVTARSVQYLVRGEDEQTLRNSLEQAQAQLSQAQEQALRAAEAQAEALRAAEAQAEALRAAQARAEAAEAQATQAQAEALRAAQAQVDALRAAEAEAAELRTQLDQARAEARRAAEAQAAEAAQAQARAQAEAAEAQATQARISKSHTKSFIDSIFDSDTRQKLENGILEYQSGSDAEEASELDANYQATNIRFALKSIYSDQSKHYVELLNEHMFNVRRYRYGSDDVVNTTGYIRNLQEGHKRNVDSYLGLLGINLEVKNFLNKNSWIFNCPDKNSLEFMLVLFKDNKDLFTTHSDSFHKLLSRASTSSKLFLVEENFANFCMAVAIISESQELIDDKFKIQDENIEDFKKSLSDDLKSASSQPASSQPEGFDPKLLIRAIGLYNITETSQNLDFSVKLSQDVMNKLKLCYYAEALFEKLYLTDNVDDELVVSYKGLYLEAKGKCDGGRDDISFIEGFFNDTLDIKSEQKIPATKVKGSFCEKLLALSRVNQDDGQGGRSLWG